jgi:hypothetical protein
MSEADADARDITELLLASNLLRAVAYRRGSETLHELASCAARFIGETFLPTGEVKA